MTAERKYGKEFKAVILISLAVFISFNFSGKLSLLTRNGLALCFNSVIGSVFPFMILSDYLSCKIEPIGFGILNRAFKKLFKINENAISAFILGIICGFPIGAKIARDQFKSEKISREEFERLIGFSNNASPAFIIAGVGASLRGSLKEGIALYLITVISAIASGMLAGIGKAPSNSAEYIPNKSFEFTSSVKDAAQNTITICGFITIFSVVSGLVIDYLNFPVLLTLIELTNACKALACVENITPAFSFALTALAISFSGLCVHMQVRSLVDNEISLKSYYITKTVCGCLAFLIALCYKLI